MIDVCVFGDGSSTASTYAPVVDWTKPTNRVPSVRGGLCVYRWCGVVCFTWVESSPNHSSVPVSIVSESSLHTLQIGHLSSYLNHDMAYLP